MDMIGIVYSAISTVEMPTLERCSNLTIYPECVQPHWPAASARSDSAIILVTCMPAPPLSRRAGLASLQLALPLRLKLYRQAMCQTRTSRFLLHKLQCLHTLLLSLLYSCYLSRPVFALLPYLPMPVD